MLLHLFILFVESDQEIISLYKMNHLVEVGVRKEGHVSGTVLVSIDIALFHLYQARCVHLMD